MAYEQRDNSGSIFVNDRKQADNHPDRTGKALIGGVEYYVNGWLKTSAKGDPFLSLSFKPVAQSGGGGGGYSSGRQTPARATPSRTTPARDPLPNEDIPF